MVSENPVKRLLLLCLLACPALATGNFTFIQAKTAYASATVAYTSSPTANNVLVVFASNYQQSGCITGISDTIGNSWTTVHSFSALANNICYAFAINTTTAADTITVTGTTTELTLIATEYQPPSAYSVLIGEWTQGSGSSIVVRGNATFVPAVDRLVISCVADYHVQHTWTSSSAAIRATDSESGPGISTVCGDDDQSGTGVTYSNTWGNGSGGTNNMFAQVLYLVSGGSGSARTVASGAVN